MSEAWFEVYCEIIDAIMELFFPGKNEFVWKLLDEFLKSKGIKNKIMELQNKNFPERSGE
jgi:hypothetical protein